MNRSMSSSVGTALRPSASCAGGEGASRSALAGLLQPADVFLSLEAANADQAISGIARFVSRRHWLSETVVRSRLAEREHIGSTAIGCGVAVPHARLKGLSRPVAAFVRTTMPISFDAPDGKPVSEMLVLLVPWDATEEHLVLLAEVAAMFSDRQFRDELRSCVDCNEVHARLTGRHRAITVE